MADRHKSAQSDVIADAKAFRERAESYWSDVYDTALADVEFVTLTEKQWSGADREARKESGKPCLTFNKIASFVRRQVNALRDEGMAPQVVPVDNSDVDDAQVREKLIQHIRDNGKADVATEWAYNQAARGGFGFYRITTEYESERSFNKRIVFKRIENQFSTYICPESRCPAGSDANEAITGEWVSIDEFKRQYPNAKADSFDDQQTETSWHDSKSIYVGEYYRVEYEPDTLYQLSDGSHVLKSEFEQYSGDLALEVVNERETQRKKIMWYKLTAHDVLESTEVEGDYIPIVLVCGDEHWIKDKRYLFSLFHDAKDSQKLYNYARTAQAEQLRKAGNRPYVAPAEAVEGYEADWENADDPNVKVLYFNHVDGNNTPLPAPFLTKPYQGSPDLMREALTTSDEIKDITGIHDASLGMASNETSGRAILARQKQGDLANYHFLDNYKLSYLHGWRIVLSMIPRVYDTARVIRITEENGEDFVLPINQPPAAQMRYADELKDRQVSINRLFNDLSVGTYDVRLQTGVDFGTQREEARQTLMELGRSYPQLMQVAGDLLINAFEFPDAQKIAERIKKTLPPEILAEDGEQNPQVMQAMQAIEQFKARIAELEAELNDKSADREAEIVKARIKQETDLLVERIRAANKIDQQQMENAVGATIGDEFAAGVYSPPDQQYPNYQPPDGGFFMPDLPAQPDGQGLENAQMAADSPYPA